jgi:hypothetical protein
MLPAVALKTTASDNRAGCAARPADAAASAVATLATPEALAEKLGERPSIALPFRSTFASAVAPCSFATEASTREEFEAAAFPVKEGPEGCTPAWVAGLPAWAAVAVSD